MFIKSDKEIDIDPVETKEWLDSIKSVIQRDGLKRAHFVQRNSPLQRSNRTI